MANDEDYDPDSVPPDFSNFAAGLAAATAHRQSSTG